MKEAMWVNGKKTIKGWWQYNWSADSFTIELNSKDRITGRYRRIVTTNDKPEWGNWKLKKEFKTEVVE